LEAPGSSAQTADQVAAQSLWEAKRASVAAILGGLGPDGKQFFLDRAARRSYLAASCNRPHRDEPEP